MGKSAGFKNPDCMISDEISTFLTKDNPASEKCKNTRILRRPSLNYESFAGIN